LRDTPTQDIAYPSNNDLEITNPLVKISYEKFGPFIYDSNISQEF